MDFLGLLLISIFSSHYTCKVLLHNNFHFQLGPSLLNSTPQSPIPSPTYPLLLHRHLLVELAPLSSKNLTLDDRVQCRGIGEHGTVRDKQVERFEAAELHRCLQDRAGGEDHV